MPFEFDALIFDCDGTLVLTGDMHLQALQEALKRQGASIERDWYMARSGLSRMQLMDQLQDLHGPAFNRGAALRDSVALTMDLLAETRPNTAVKGIAERFHGHVPMAVASNAEAEIVRGVLDIHGLSRFFAAIVTISEVSRPKPDPEMLVKAASLLGSRPDRTLVLEDSEQGLVAAEAAGMPVLDVRDPTALDKFRQSNMDYLAG
ncbi:HAD family phosphatase [Roseibium sp. RKSG952]|uniref:HAD family hydrolase n=1 Tax=Roseibium sp. RKSG952 TaxID=2529384 RepID=UPI0018AD2CEC|nr:HAD family phosphatase [Roseibium sp. RKSG952]